MAIAVSQLTELGSSSNITGPFTTPSFNPAIGDQIVVVIQATATTDDTVTVTESAGGGTYTLALVQSWSGTSSRMYVYVRTALCAATTARTISATLPADAATGKWWTSSSARPPPEMPMATCAA